MAEEYVFQHYVPQFYLRTFRDSEGLLHCLHVDESRRFPVSAGSDSTIGIAASDYYFDETDEKWLEKGLGVLEGDWADAVDRLLSDGEIEGTSDGIKADLLMFVTIQYIRTKATRDSLLDTFSDDSCQLNDSLVSDLREFITTDDGRDAHVLLLKEVTRLLYDRLKDHGEFVLRKNDTAIPYITSDNPVVQFHHDRPDTFDYRNAIGVGGTDWELYFPLTPKRCLAVRYSENSIDHGGKTEHVQESHVEHQNTLQLVQSSEIAICNNDEYRGITNIW